jgi:hypothetical protein
VRFDLWRLRLLGASLGAALACAACGPGVGGTGTGGAFVAFGAGATSVCNGAIGAELSCLSQAPAASGAAASGTLPVQFVDAAGRITLDLNGDTATLQAACERLRFTGEFGIGAGGVQGFFGSYEVDANGVDLLAALSAAPGEGMLTISLRDIGGNVLVQPVLLQRAAVPLPAPNPC